MNDLDDRLARWNPVPVGDLPNMAGSPEAAGLLTVTLHQPVVAGARSRVPSRRRMSMRAGVAAVAAAAVAVTVVGLWPSGDHPHHRRGAATDLRFIDFSVRHGNTTVLITDPYAAASQLTAEMRAHGLDISVRAVPVSPSLIGTIVFTDAPVIRALSRPGCDGGCSIGFVIPAGFTGRADIIVGRRARRGEMYESMADAFAPGEVLHCSGLLGAPASAAVPVLRRLGLAATWWDYGRRPERPSGYIVDATPLSATLVGLDTAPFLPRNQQFRQQVADYNEGCH